MVAPGGARVLGLESKYAYATGRVRVLETRLLDRGRLDRMVDAPDLEGAAKVLAEAGYVRAQASDRACPGIEEIIGAEEERLVTVVRETSPEPGLVEFITARWDYHNLKVMLKAKLHRAPPERAIARQGAVDVRAIERAIDGNARDLSPHLARGLAAAKAAHARRPSPDSIDIAVDREMHAFLLEKASALRLPYLVDLVQMEIDLLNIGILFRARKMGKDSAFLSEALAPGGAVPIHALVGVYEQPVEAVLRALAGTRYEPVVREAIAAQGHGKPLTEYERLAEAAMWREIRKARRVPLGPEPLVGFIFAKLYELRLARLVLAAKASGIPRDTVTERLRDVHV